MLRSALQGAIIALCTFALSGVAPLLAQTLNRAPITFEKYAERSAPNVKYLSRGADYALFLAPNEAVISLRKSGGEAPFQGAVVRMRLLGGDPNATAVALSKLPGTSNYFLGKDPAKWRTGVENYGKVGFQGVYRGVDVVYYGAQKRLEYDFVLHPNANLAAIRLQFAGAKRVKPLPNGELWLETGNGSLKWRSPVAYQQIQGKRVPVSAKYALKSAGEVCFKAGAYDHSKPLVIDPELAYSTYIGGSDYDYANSVAIDGEGNAYITGYTFSPDYPVTIGAYQTIYQPNYADAFITKLSANGKTLIYSTYLGGSAQDEANAIAVDSSGNAYIAGTTDSRDFPVTLGAYQTAYKGTSSAFIAKLNAKGAALLYSTFLGGTDWQTANAIAVDSGGSAYVTGSTLSKDFPSTKGVIQDGFNGGANFGDAFITRLSADGKSLLASTYIGGDDDDFANGIALDGKGFVYITGGTYSADFPVSTGCFQATNKASNGTVFVAKCNVALTQIAYATYLGGSVSDTGAAIALDSSQNAYITGYTSSANFPATKGAFQTFGAYNYDQDAFVTKLSATGKTLVYSTFLGGSQLDYAYSIAVDSDGHAYVAGYTVSDDYPTTQGAFQTPIGGEFYYTGFVSKLTAAGDALLNSTYLTGGGTSAQALAIDSAKSAYIVGSTSDIAFATTLGAFQTSLAGFKDAFAMKLAMTDNTAKSAASVTLVNSAIENTATATIAATLLRAADSAPIANRPLKFTLDGAALGAQYTTGGGGRATLPLNASLLTVGNHKLAVSFAGDGDNSPVAVTYPLAVTLIKTAMMVSANNDYGQGASGKYGATIPLQAQLYGVATSNVIEGETITLLMDGVSIGTGKTDNTGSVSATYLIPDSLSLGSHTFTAKFAGDSVYLPSVKTDTLTTLLTATSLTLAGGVSGRIGDTVPFAATLIRTTDKSGLAGKTITFYLAGTAVGTAVASAAGVATLSYFIDGSLPVGSVALTANFAGDAQYLAPANVKAQTLTIKQAPTKLAGQNESGKRGSAVTLPVTLTRTTDHAPLSGKPISFQIDGKTVGSATTDSNGVANYSYSIPTAMTVGKHTLAYLFAGDASYLKYTGTGNTLTVN